MPSLKNDFNELIRRISYGRELANASFDPIYYLVFDPKQILQVKRQLPAWAAKLRNEGWEVTIFSIADNIYSIFRSAPLLEIWLKADRRSLWPGIRQTSHWPMRL